MNLIKLIIVALFSVALFACAGSNHERVDEGVSLSEDSMAFKINRIQERSQSGSHQLAGKKYGYNLSFKNDTNVVVNPQDYRFYDNKVRLVVRSGSTPVVDRTFTKNAFREYMKSDFFSKFALIGFTYNYDMADDHHAIHFIATVGDPDLSSDIYESFDVAFSASGDMVIKELENNLTDHVSSIETEDPEMETEQDSDDDVDQE